MKKGMFVSLCLLVVTLVTLGASNSCKAPMDVTGSYSGNWSFDIKEGETILDTIDCPLTMTLNQDATLNPPNNLNITGTVYVDFSCLAEVPNWPDWLPIPEPNDVAVTGTMNYDGIIVLGTGDCGPGTCIILALDAYGDSDNPNEVEIPDMTSYSGNWGLAISISFLGTAGVNGTFEVTRD